MAIDDRPYVGTWEQGKQTIVKHTPDARVLINGQEEFAICATCNKKTDFNKYITSVSVDPSTDPISTATISLSVPRHASDVFSHDGNYVLEPGLEIVVQMRGYFPVKGYAAKGQDENESGLASEETPVYPYYQVFRGVVTEVSHEFSGGFYTASVSCANILHFWQYLYLATNGSVFGKTPDQAGVNVDLTGHRFTGMSPYGIMYTLMRVGFGSAFGVNWTISTTTNITAKDDASGEPLFKHAAQWWEKRWQESSMRLRMYGFDGTLFNSFEQAYLGIFDGKKNASLIQSFGIMVPDDKDFNNSTARMNAARRAGYRGTETVAAIADEDGYKIDAAKMQAFTLDLGRLGSVNFFETEYMTKLEIANAAKEITGFEFYQDVDGDIVFKPPFYNLDTSNDPVYRIADRDLISISESEREPEATYVKGSGSMFPNFTGIISGEFGDRQGKYVDWRLVAKFGWKETSFESHYYSGSKQMFLACLMRLDVANMEMRSASITIPLRPELRPGYPVYVEHLDCFYYIKSMSHSYAAGTTCQTTLTCGAKRAKWLPPGLPDRSEGKIPSLDNVRLGNPGEYPPMPMYVFPEDTPDAEEGSSGPPRIQGYPNVVMAFDPDKINPTTVPGMPTLSEDTLLDITLSLGILRRNPDDPENNSFLLSGGDSFLDDTVIQKTDLLTSYGNVAAELKERFDNGDTSATAQGSIRSIVGDDAAGLAAEGFVTSEAIGTVILAVFSSEFSNIEDADNLNRYMALQRSLKNVFGASNNTAGEYRYFSSSAPNVEDQSPSEFLFDSETGEITKTPVGGVYEALQSKPISLLRQVGDRIHVQEGYPDRAFRVYGLSPDDDADTAESPYVDVTTRDIRFLNFSLHGVKVPVTSEQEETTGPSRLLFDVGAMEKVFTNQLRVFAIGAFRDDPESYVYTLFGVDPINDGKGGYGTIFNDLNLLAGSLASSTGATDEQWSSVDAALEKYSPGSGDGFTNSFGVFKEDKAGDPIKTGTIGAVTGLRGEVGIIRMASQIGWSLAQGVLAVIQEAYLTLKVDGPEIFDDEGRVVTGGPSYEPSLLDMQAFGRFRSGFPVYRAVSDGSHTSTSSGNAEKPLSTAVLPVSDNAGYEVYGAMPYGRGLDITKYKGLLELGGSPTTQASMLAVERFFAALAINGAEVAKAVLALPAEDRATLAADLEATDDSDLVSKINAIFEDDSESVFARNTPVTSRSRGMSNTLSVSISELADLTAEGNTVCLCKGVEATFFLQAFTGDFVELVGDDAVNDFLMDEAAVAGEKHQITRQALAGQTLDTRFENKLKEVSANDYESVRSLGRTAASEFEQTRDGLEFAGTSVQQVDLSPDGEG